MTVVRRKKHNFPTSRSSTMTYVDPVQHQQTTNNATTAHVAQPSVSNALVIVRGPRTIVQAGPPFVRFGRRNRPSYKKSFRFNIQDFLKYPFFHRRRTNFKTRLAKLVFTNELANRIRDGNVNGIAVYCLPPETVRTELLKHLDNTDSSSSNLMLRVLLGYLSKTQMNDTQTIIYCAVDERAHKLIGVYYSEARASNVHIVDDGENWTGGLQIVAVEDPVYV